MPREEAEARTSAFLAANPGADEAAVAALATIKAELGWRWLGFAIAFMVLVAWVLGFGVYQVGSLASL
jgi:hypothetical protein